MDHTLWLLLCSVCSREFYLHLILGLSNASVVDLSLTVAIPRATGLLVLSPFPVLQLMFTLKPPMDDGK